MRSASLTRRTTRVTALAAIICTATAGAAFAITGSVAQARQVVFYYGETSGNGDSKDFSGYGTAKLCADAPGATSNNNFGVQSLRNRTLQPDDVLKDRLLAYSSARYLSASFSTSSSSKYHTYVNWSAVPSANDAANGYSRAVGSSC